MSFRVRRDEAGLWEITAPSGQVFGLAPTRDEAVAAVKHLGRVQGLAARGVAAVEVTTMSETMRARLAYARRERSRREWARRDPALDRWLNARKRRNAA